MGNFSWQPPGPCQARDPPNREFPRQYQEVGSPTQTGGLIGRNGCAGLLQQKVCLVQREATGQNVAESAAECSNCNQEIALPSVKVFIWCISAVQYFSRAYKHF